STMRSCVASFCLREVRVITSLLYMTFIIYMFGCNVNCIFNSERKAPRAAGHQGGRKSRDGRVPQGDTGLTPITNVPCVAGFPKGYRSVSHSQSERVLRASLGYSTIRAVSLWMLARFLLTSQ